MNIRKQIKRFRIISKPIIDFKFPCDKGITIIYYDENFNTQKDCDKKLQKAIEKYQKEKPYSAYPVIEYYWRTIEESEE